ncbi:MAG TPA: DUF3891 family protein [Terracidiphilus sp.]|jgi:hypothetical protein|nr:DUF3891 family protein [Terracidiphilus sp.]
MESETGWWLIRHPDHAELAGAFAAAWGNALFRKPEPRQRVLHGIARHDDGWAVRDAHPSITRQGKPSAFSTELVGKYSAFEEIDLQDYLAVRDRAVRMIAEKDPYAGLLIALHTYNLLTAHADRSTITPEGLLLLDAFLERQRGYQDELRAAIEADATLTPRAQAEQTVTEHFRLLQACDNLSLLTCVAYTSPAHLLHPLSLNDGSTSEVQVFPLGPRHFRLEPWPFAEAELTFEFPARHVAGKTFGSSEQLTAAYLAAEEQRLSVTLSRSVTAPH